MGGQGATARVPNFRTIPEKEFVLLTPKVKILEKCCDRDPVHLKL